jgi:hypothetical protein
MIERDTTPEAHRVQIEVLRRMGPARRASLTLAMSEDLRRLTLERIAARSPALDSRARIRALVALLHGEEIARKAFAASTFAASVERSDR